MKKALMKQRSLQTSEINEITGIMQNKEYQRACRKHFELTHKGASVESVGNHPNAWFDESIKFNERQKGTNPTIPDQNNTPSQVSFSSEKDLSTSSTSSTSA